MAAGDTPITVVGNLVADPELRFTASGQPVATFRIASTPREKRTVFEVEVDDVGPSLRNASAKVARANRTGGAGGGGYGAPSGGQGSGGQGGGGQGGGGQGGGYGGQPSGQASSGGSGGQASSSGGSRNEDPWASDAGYSDEPPF
jgi:single-strand DNA-binding protein